MRSYLLILLLAGTSAFTQVPRSLSYQGVLRNNSGTVVADGDYPIRIVLYATRTGSVELYAKADTVRVTAGIFTIILDSLPASLTFDRQYYLGITIADGTE